MIKYSDCRPGNFILLGDEIAEITSVNKRTLACSTPKDPSIEMLRRLDSDDVCGIELTRELLMDKLHFVEFKGPDYREDVNNEYTDGRIILRSNEDLTAVFIPNTFPWAEAMGIHMDYVTMIGSLHQLQNIYWDLFKTDLDTSAFSNPPPR